MDLPEDKRRRVQGVAAGFSVTAYPVVAAAKAGTSAASGSFLLNPTASGGLLGYLCLLAGESLPQSSSVAGPPARLPSTVPWTPAGPPSTPPGPPPKSPTAAVVSGIQPVTSPLTPLGPPPLSPTTAVVTGANSFSSVMSPLTPLGPPPRTPPRSPPVRSDDESSSPPSTIRKPQASPKSAARSMSATTLRWQRSSSEEPSEVQAISEAAVQQGDVR